MLKSYVRAREAARRLVHDRKGVTAMEYGIIAAVTVVVVGGVVGGLNGPLTTIWNNIATALNAAAG
jgi:pilus assembly protein Flp/PilA